MILIMSAPCPTWNLEKRFWEHNQGLGAKYTARRLPVELVFAQEFHSIAEVYQREKQVQGWRRAKREALIQGDYDALPELSKSKSDTTRDRKSAD